LRRVLSMELSETVFPGTKVPLIGY
jgi:hypothetical protein